MPGLRPAGEPVTAAAAVLGDLPWERLVGLEATILAPPMVFNGVIKEVTDLHVKIALSRTLAVRVINRGAIRKITPSAPGGAR